MGWRHEKDTLFEFINNANRLQYPTIKFTYSFFPETVNFLETTLHLINNHIKTELYTKPTDTHQYLLRNFCHSRYIIKKYGKSLHNVSNAFALQRPILKNMPLISSHTKFHDPIKKAYPENN